tara:strand:+ start:162 stop:620 length:459 start_codon:yes stop_codon:yes gene_type:complete
MVNEQIRTKKSFTTRDFVIAGVLFSTIVALFVLAIAGIQDQYNTDILTNEDFSANYDKLSDQVAKIGTARNSSAEASGLSLIGRFDVAFQSTFTVFQMVYQSLGLFDGMTQSFGGDFGLDATVTRIIFLSALAILTTLIVWQLVGAISRGRI